MAVKVATQQMLLDALMENSKVKAAVLVDDRGYIIEKRGTALSLRGNGDEEQALSVESPPKSSGPSENLYLVQAGTDFLIVVFDDRMNFERLKAGVDETLARFDMALPVDDE